MKNKILVNYWTLLIGVHLQKEYYIDNDHALDLTLYPIDKDTCISINHEIDAITIYTKIPDGISGEQVCHDEGDDSKMWKLMTDSKSWEQERPWIYS